MQTNRIARIVLAASIGLALGVSAYTFIYAKGYSYLSNDPAACVNCHAMNEQYDGWIKSSHRVAATCNDCHTPAGFVGKYTTKASNGFWHSFYFTTGWYPEHIRINDRNRQIAEDACQKCHADIVEAMDGPHQAEKISCIQCHGSVGHPK